MSVMLPSPSLVEVSIAYVFPRLREHTFLMFRLPFLDNLAGKLGLVLVREMRVYLLLFEDHVGTCGAQNPA